MNTITGIKGELLKNSRGTETICVTVQTENHQGSFMVPEGASTGSTEVLAKSASEALSILEEKILPQMRGIEVTNQKEIDAVLHEIDQSELFEGIGGNTALGVSVAVCKTAAKVEGVPTWKYIERLFGQKKQAPAPRLFVNLINGGKHATFGSPIQEHQLSLIHI